MQQKVMPYLEKQIKDKKITEKEFAELKTKRAYKSKGANDKNNTKKSIDKNSA
jgi:hypothetical protein